MAITNGYTTGSAVKSALGIIDANSDTELELVIESVSRLIDDYCGRFFYNAGTVTATTFTNAGTVSATGGAINAAFVEQLGQCAERGEILLFLCRSGVRSRYAAKLATENGFMKCYDILEGFEGDRDDEGHRKSVGGWCHAGLPWVGA